jgi:anthranilate phosphoribosyltransferase
MESKYTMDMQTAIRRVTEKEDLSVEEMTTVMRLIMSGEATSAQTAGFLVGLRMKGETTDEIASAATVMREMSTKVPIAEHEHLVDTCGTGGDGLKTFNISTACAFVVAAAGAKVAKHGNRSVSSSTGSADVLEAAGVRLDLSAEEVAQCVDKVGVGFMFAPNHHSAMKHVVGPRREMAVRTVFNLLGPLTNPAVAPNQVIGVFSRQWLCPITEVLQRLGSRHVMAVAAEDGMDEISIGGKTYVSELYQGRILSYTITPDMLGLEEQDCRSLVVSSAEQSLVMIRDVFNNVAGAARDIVLLNAGAAIYVAGLSEGYREGVTMAADILASGQAAEKLDALVSFSQQLKSVEIK